MSLLEEVESSEIWPSILQPGLTVGFLLVAALCLLGLASNH